MYLTSESGEVGGQPELVVVFVQFVMKRTWICARETSINLYENGVYALESNGCDDQVIRIEQYPYRVDYDKYDELHLPKVSDWIEQDCITKVVFCNQVRVCEVCHSASVTARRTKPMDTWGIRKNASPDALRLELLQSIPNDLGEPFKWNLCEDCSADFKSRNYAALVRKTQRAFSYTTEQEKILLGLSRKAAIAEANRKKSKAKLSPFFGELNALTKIK